MPDAQLTRLMTKVARLYHTHGMRQTDIAARLQISQSRVSRLLTQAEEIGVVRTVVAVPTHIYADLEESVERAFPVQEVHVVDTVSDDMWELGRDLAHATAMLLGEVTFEAPTIGYMSWSRTLRMVTDDLQPLRTNTRQVVEMLGDLGSPAQQHDAAQSTRRLAQLAGAEAVFLRTPGVVACAEIRERRVKEDAYAREALSLLDSVDLAILSIGACEVDPATPTAGITNRVTAEQYARMRELGAVGQICLHFLDADGNPVAGEIDDLIVGATRHQLKAARRRWAVAGGPRKHAAIRAALAGGWVDTLVTDAGTAKYLAS